MPSTPDTSDVVAGWLQVALVTLGLLAGAAGLGLGLRWFTGELHQERAARRRRRDARRAVPAGPVPRRPLETVAADLRRLGRELARVPAGASQTRRLGLLAAYDDVLVEAAAALDVPHVLPDAFPGAARELERLRLVAALEDAGLVLTGPGGRG